MTLNWEDCAKIIRSEQLPHGSNLSTKIAGSKKFDGILREISKAYAVFASEIRRVKTHDAADVKMAVEALNAYLDFICAEENNQFSHQSDFTSSVIPEFFQTYIAVLIKNRRLKLEVNGQKDLIIEATFSARENEPVAFKYKRVDIAAIHRVPMQIDSTKIELPIPAVAIEAKTNLDKNMISGIEHSVERLKRTFPTCRYFVISELADFDSGTQNYATTSIDEIFILRRQKRSASRGSGGVRASINSEGVRDVLLAIDDALADTALKKASLGDRLRDGKMIAGLPPLEGE